MCIDFADLNKACSKDSYLPSNIDSLMDVASRYTILSFCDTFSDYNQTLMWERDHLKMAFIIDEDFFCYRVMSFGLKNAGATY